MEFCGLTGPAMFGALSMTAGLLLLLVCMAVGGFANEEGRKPFAAAMLFGVLMLVVGFVVVVVFGGQ